MPRLGAQCRYLAVTNEEAGQGDVDAAPKGVRLAGVNGSVASEVKGEGAGAPTIWSN